MAGAVIREAGAADTAILVALSRECFGDAGWSRQLFEDMLAVANRRGGSAAMICLLAEDSGAPIGYVAAQVAGDEVEIHSLAVLPRLHRQGWGSRLLRTALDTAAGLGAMNAFLEVRAGNQAARAFYLRQGFHETGVRSGYYPDTGEAALLMKRRLSESGQ